MPTPVVKMGKRKSSGSHSSGGHAQKKRKKSLDEKTKRKTGKSHTSRNGSLNKQVVAKPETVEEGGEESSSDEETKQYIMDNPQYASFLLGLDTEQLTSKTISNKALKREKKEKREAMQPTAPVEAKPRAQASTSGWNVKEPTLPQQPQRLPVKTRDGVIHTNMRFTEEDQQEDPAEGDSSHENTSVDGNEGPASSNVAGEKRAQSKQNGVTKQTLSNGSGTNGTTKDTPDNSSDQDEDDEADGDSDDVYDSADDDNGNYMPEVGSVGELPRGKIQQERMDPVDLIKLRKRRLARKKVEIAQLCEAILRDPEEALIARKENVKENGAVKGERQTEDGGAEVKEKISKVQQLHRIAETDDDILVQQLAMLSLFAVFKDLIPSYRIRVLTEKERGLRVSKDVQKVRDHERALLASYQNYLKLLETVIRTATESSRRNSKAISSQHNIALSAVKCQCELLHTHPHFNFRANLSLAVVERMDHEWDDLSDECYKCITTIFKEDKSGEVSLELVKAISKYARTKKNQVSEKVIRCLSALPLLVSEDDSKRVRSVAKARNRKRREAGVEAEMMEAEAEVDPALKAKCHADILQEVTLTYFRVLKTHRNPALLPPVMEGLAKFAHLINLDTVEDVLALLRQLLEEDKLTLQASLHCVIMAFRTLQGPGRELKIDDNDFLGHLYCKLPRLLDPKHRMLVPLVLECIDVVFIKRREASATRVASFFKRLLSLALHFPKSDAYALITAAHSLALRYQPVRQMLENELDHAATAPYTHTVTDPALANPFSTSCWELSLLKFSAHPDIVSSVMDMGRLGTQDPAEAVAATYLRQVSQMSSSGGSTGNMKKLPIFSGVPAPSFQNFSHDGSNASSKKGEQGGLSFPREFISAE